MIDSVRVSRWNIRIQKRLQIGFPLRLLALFLALFAAMFVSGLLVRSAGADVREAFLSLLAGAFGGRRAILQTLLTSTPLIFTGLAVALAFQGQVFNIGAEGQLFAGAMAAYWATLLLPEMPRVPLLIAVTLAAVLGGALCGLIPAILKVRFQVNVILSTVMLNYVVGFALSYLLSAAGPWQDPAVMLIQSPRLPEQFHYPTLLTGSRLHLGFLIALVMAGIIYIVLRRTPLGFEIRAIGHNDLAARFKGILSERVVLITMFLSGGLAGLAGASELLGIHQRLKPELSTDFGFTGIIIAMLAGLDPRAVVVAAILFGALQNGAFRMQVATGVPTALAFAMQAIILLFFLASQAMAQYRIRIDEVR